MQRCANLPNSVATMYRGDIIKIQATSYEPLVYGHTAAVCGVAWHPKKHHCFVSVADDCHVLYWNAELRQLIAKCTMGASVTGRSVAIGPDGLHVAIGCVDGGLRVLLLENAGSLPLSSEARSTH